MLSLQKGLRFGVREPLRWREVEVSRRKTVWCRARRGPGPDTCMLGVTVVQPGGSGLELQICDRPGWGYSEDVLEWNPRNDMTVGMWSVAPGGRAEEILVPRVSRAL